MSQTTATAAPAVAVAGMPADNGPKQDDSYVVESAAGIAPGLAVYRGTGGADHARVCPVPATDADAIMAALATAASTQTLDTELGGVIGTGLIAPPRKVTIQRSSHADQNAVTAVLTGLDQNGNRVTEEFSFADGGGDSFTSTYYYSKVESLVIPAQAGTGGTTEIGVAATFVVSPKDFLGIGVHSTMKTRFDGSNTNVATYEQYDRIPVRRAGRIYCVIENAFEAGDQLFIRHIATGNEVLGALRVTDTDSGDCALAPMLRLLSSGDAGAFGIVEINLPG